MDPESSEEPIIRYPADQKEKARRRIIESGAKVLKKGGFAAVGVDEVAAAAGVTSGALYSNFSGKEELLGQVIAAYLGAPYVNAGSDQEVDWHARFEQFLRTYITLEHRRDPSNGCVMPALSADVSRASAAVRKIYQRKMVALIDKISRSVAGKAPEARKRAWSILALMVGSMTVARALPDGREAEEMVAAALESALKMLKD